MFFYLQPGTVYLLNLTAARNTATWTTKSLQRLSTIESLSCDGCQVSFHLRQAPIRTDGLLNGTMVHSRYLVTIAATCIVLPAFWTTLHLAVALLFSAPSTVSFLGSSWFSLPFLHDRSTLLISNYC